MIAWGWVALAATLYPGTVTLREHEPSPPGQVTAVTLNGITLKDSTQTTELSWDRIATVEGDLADQAQQFMALSERLWRARKRMERGDLVLAEPSLESLAEEFPAAAGPTGLLMQSARVSCRLLRGAQVSALDPYTRFLACMSEDEIRGAKVRQATRGLDAMPPRTRPSGILIPDFPPMWLDVPSLRVVIDFKTEIKGAQSAALVNLYMTAARFEADSTKPVADFPAIDAGDDGDLVREIVVARAGNKDQRAKAREALLKRIHPGTEEWRESWVRVGIGRSLIREESVDDRLTGVAQLLQAPARFSHVTPYAAGLALAEAAVTLRDVSERAEADRLVAELREKYAHHPALDYRPLREWHILSTSKLAPISGSPPVSEPVAPAPSSEGGPK